MELLLRGYYGCIAFVCFINTSVFCQLIIAQHEHCQNDDINRVDSFDDLSGDDRLPNVTNLIKRWCNQRLTDKADDQLKCLESLSRICQREQFNVADTCPFLVRHKRDFGVRAEKASKEDLAKLKSGFGQLAQQFIASLFKPNQKGLLSDVMLNDGPTQQRDVQNNELQINNPDNYFHGDMDMSKNQVDYFMKLLEQGATALFNNAVDKLAAGGSLLKKDGTRKKRKMGKEPAYHLWPTTTNPIPYQFHKNVPNPTRQIIEDAIHLWEANTCRRWAKDIPGIDRIEFVNGDGCSSFVGKTGGTQEISVRSPGCDSVGVASHEIGHSLGFFHEQGRPDQAANVQINYANILPRVKDNFLPMPKSDVNTYNLPYELGSVMHYDSMTRGFTSNPKKYAINTKDPKYQNTIGQRIGPSFIDYKLINLAYCSKICPSKLGCTRQGYEDPNNCLQCKCPSGLGGHLCESVEPSSPGCGGVIKASSQVQYIQSPSYPQQFPTGLTCNWLILAPLGGKIHLTFDNTFSFPCDEVCTFSYVEVKRSQDFQRTGYRFCCTQPPSQIVSESNEMIVRFNSNGRQGNGFKASVSTDSTGVITGPLPTAPPPMVATQAPVTTFKGVTPKLPSGCDCDDWGPWSECTQPCGGCGYISRSRTCNRVNCYNKEKKHCNFNQCPGTSNVLINNGNFDLIFNGCCVGMFPANNVCGGLSEAVSQFFSGLVNQAASGSNLFRRN